MGPPPSSPSHVVHADLPYLGTGRAEKLDAYLPDAAAHPGPRPAVLLIHGGGWRGGDKADAREREIGAAIARHGHVVVSINYLLNESRADAGGRTLHIRVAWPRNLEDCEAALRWLETEGAAAFRVDPARLAVMGSSAGGHLAMLLAARHPGRLRAVVSFYGIGFIDDTRLAAFAGATPDETAARADAASPVRRLTRESPPILLVHGDADKLVPVSHARWLANEFSRRGVPHMLIEVPGAGHSFALRAAQRDLLPDLLAFLAARLR